MNMMRNTANHSTICQIANEDKITIARRNTMNAICSTIDTEKQIVAKKVDRKHTRLTVVHSPLIPSIQYAAASGQYFPTKIRHHPDRLPICAIEYRHSLEPAKTVNNFLPTFGTYKMWSADENAIDIGDCYWQNIFAIANTQIVYIHGSFADSFWTHLNKK